MDEQTIAQSSNYDISADGAANQSYEEEPLQATPEGQSTPEADEELAPDGLRVRDGELEFGEGFFGDVKDSPEEEPPAPNWYTDKELEEIPFQQWDMSRLNGDIPVSRIAPIVQRQLQRQQESVRSQAWENAPLPSDITEPKAYTPQELSQEALKLACEKLGIEDADEFDSYELEHKAAYELAAQELMQRRNAEISGYQNVLQSWRENAKYQDELSRRPDFRDFGQWFLGECQRGGITPQQVEVGLYNMVRQNGNNFGLIKQTMEGWYQIFRSQQGAKTPAQKPGMRRIPRTPSPAVLESTGGNNYAGRPSFRPEAFAKMTNEEQERALIQLGYV